MSELSIVVGTYNRLDQIRRCMESIFDQTTANFRIYVTDAGSTDGTVKYLKSVASDKVIPILVGRKLGQAKAYNDVFKIVETPYVCWLSDDNVILNRGLDVAVSILEADSRIGMVGLKTKDVRGPFVNQPYIGGVLTIGILNVNQGMLPTHVLKQVGGFSETFRDYGIDPDLTAKVFYAGYDIVYTREIVIHHYRSWEMEEGSLAHSELEQKHCRFRMLYEEKFGSLANNAPIWRLKCAAWSFIRAASSFIAKSEPFIKNAWRLFKKTWWFNNRVSRFIRKTINAQRSPNSTRWVDKSIARDWQNVFTGRYISLLDRFRCAGKPYYLRQHCPWYRTPRVIPQDAVPFPAIDVEP